MNFQINLRLGYSDSKYPTGAHFISNSFIELINFIFYLFSAISSATIPGRSSKVVEILPDGLLVFFAVFLVYPLNITCI